MGVEGWFDVDVPTKTENTQNDVDFWSEISAFDLNKKIQNSKGVELDFLQYKLGVITHQYETF